MSTVFVLPVCRDVVLNFLFSFYLKNVFIFVLYKVNKGCVILEQERVIFVVRYKKTHFPSPLKRSEETKRGLSTRKCKFSVTSTVLELTCTRTGLT